MAQVERAQEEEEGAMLSLPQLLSSFSNLLCLLPLLDFHLFQCSSYA